MNDCFPIPPSCYIHTRVKTVPLSKDEIDCMREAQYLSAAQQGPNSSTTQPSQLDPGSLYDPSRRSASSKVAAASTRGGGANSLLKQAIANRLKPSESTANMDDEMNKSIVGNPAWYRDNDGKTGVKPKEMQDIPNVQKSEVKYKQQQPEEPPSSTELYDQLLSKEQRREERRKRKEAQKNLEEAMKTLEETAKDEPEVQLTKEEKKQKEKEQKEKEKQDKKAQKEKEKEEKKAQKEKEKEDKKKQKEEKKNKSQTSLNKSETEEEVSKTEEKSIKPKKSLKESKQKDKKHEEIVKTSKEKTSSSVVVRRDSNDSNASSQRSTNTVKEVVSPRSHRKPPSGRNLQKPSVQSPQSSSTEEEKTASKHVAKDKKPRKETIGERRDSTLSESSRISAVSHKSVTFCDRIQTHEIERFEMMSSSEDDAAVMSDDELSKPDSERRRRLVRLLQEQKNMETYEDDDDEFERTEKQVMKGQIPPGYPVYDLDNTSENSFYPEDHDPDRYLMDEEGSYISLDHLPTAVRRAIAVEMRTRTIRDQDVVGMGSMTKLHDQGSNPPSLLSYPQLPRSASGYLDEQQTDMHNSYKQAMYGQAFHHSSPDPKKLQESFYDNVPSRTGSLLEPQTRPVEERRSSDTSQKTSLDRAAFFGTQATQKMLVTTSTTTSTTTNKTEIIKKEEAKRDPKNEDDMRKQFIAKFGLRRAPMAEEDPTDPVHDLGSQESVLSSGSNESVVSAASIRTESTIRRDFNY